MSDELLFEAEKLMDEIYKSPGKRLFTSHRFSEEAISLLIKFGWVEIVPGITGEITLTDEGLETMKSKVEGV